MGRHSVPRGEKSTLGAANGSPGTPGYQGRHRKEAGSDLPPRGKGVTHDNSKGK